MGDVAASGGYYSSMGADEIFASPTTITGSIGVFVLKPSVEGLAQKLGANLESIKTAPLADLMEIYRAWTPEEQAAAQKWVDAFYDSFITEVASSRKLDKARVDGLARGRVWSGEDAKARGLVDSMGGLSEAIEAAKKRANVADQEVDLVVYGEPHSLLASPGGEEGVGARALGLLQSALGDGGALQGVLLGTPAREALPPGLKELAADLGVQAELLRAPGVIARMPFTLRVE
jgi:protease IV